MTHYSVLGRLRLMMELDDQGARMALPFCAAAVEHLLPQLKDVHANDPRLDQAAAAMACCLLLRRAQEEDGIASFKAGDITVTKGGKDRLAWAQQARRDAMEDIQDLLKDTGFYASQTSYQAPTGKAPTRKRRGQ